MPGTYPNYTEQRMAYDADGTIVVVYDPDTDTVVQLSQSTLQRMNSEVAAWPGYEFEGGEYTDVRGTIAFVFPQARNVTGYFVCVSEEPGSAKFSNSTGIQVSSNTTNGINGTWTTASAGVTTSQSMLPNYRTVTSFSAVNIKAVRFTKATASESILENLYATNIHVLHLYGTQTSASDRLEFWKPSTDSILTPSDLDFGDIARETTTTKTFRVKNLSSTLTANSVVISASTISTASGESTVVGEYSFSTDNGVTYGSTRTISSIAPGAISGVVTARRITTETSLLSVHSVRVNAIAGSWS